MAKSNNITQKTTAEINNLKKRVSKAQRHVQTSTAAFEAAQVNAKLYIGLLAEADAKLLVSTDEYAIVKRSQQNVESLQETDDEAKKISDKTFKNADDLISDVNDAVTQALSAASSITSVAQLITDRKAANPLISSELVSRAQTSVGAADQSATQIIGALASVTNALSTAAQANNTAKLVFEEIEKLMGVVGENDKENQKDTNNAAETLLQMIMRRYESDRKEQGEFQEAVRESQDQLEAASSTLNSAIENLAKAQAALQEAEAVVGASAQ